MLSIASHTSCRSYRSPLPSDLLSLRCLTRQREVVEWVYFRYLDLYTARDQSQTSTEPPRDCVNVFLRACYTPYVPCSLPTYCTVIAVFFTSSYI